MRRGARALVLSAVGLLAAAAPGQARGVPSADDGAYLERACAAEGRAGVDVARCIDETKLARDATARYRDPLAAVRDGFVPLSSCERSAGGVMGEHWGRLDRLADDRLDPREPEVLLYVPSRAGRTLMGAEWVINESQTSGAPSRFGRRLEGPMAGHNAVQPRHYDVHVWLWRSNPAGLFAQFNPDLRCGAGPLGEGAQATGGCASGGAGPCATPGYRLRRIVRANAIPKGTGVVLDGRGHLFVSDALSSRIHRVDLRTRSRELIAHEFDSAGEPVVTGEDIEIDRHGSLYVTEVLSGSVVRMDREGGNRKVVARLITSGPPSGPTGIGWRRVPGQPERLFVVDGTHGSESDPRSGGLWDVDPKGLLPARRLVSGLGNAQSLTFDPDGLGYVPDYLHGRIHVVDVNRPLPVRELRGFEYPFANEWHPDGYLVVVEHGGHVWRVDPGRFRTDGSPRPGAKTLLARGPVGMDPVTIAPDGTAYFSNNLTGNAYRLDPERHRLKPLFRKGEFSYPISLNPGRRGSIWIGDLFSISRLGPDGRVQRLSNFISSDNQWITPSVAELGGAIYATELFPLIDTRVVRLERRPDGGFARVPVARGFVLPGVLRPGPGGHLLVGDQGLGAVLDTDPDTGLVVPVVAGLSRPAGLAYDERSGVAYISESGTGRVLAVTLATRAQRVVARGLNRPEGVAVAGEALYVVEGDSGAAGTPGRLLRIDLATGELRVIAERLPTQLDGADILPVLNFPSDVLVRPDGSIIVTGDGDGSLIEIERTRP